MAVNVSVGESERLVIRFDHDSQTIYRGNAKRCVPGNVLAGAVCCEYVERIGARTPTGGVFISRRMTIRTRDGRKWVGQMRKDSDIVRLRLAC